jgi:hypothetical protein
MFACSTSFHFIAQVSEQNWWRLNFPQRHTIAPSLFGHGSQPQRLLNALMETSNRAKERLLHS